MNVLDYAGPKPPEVPEWNDEAERRIDEGESPRALASIFDKNQEIAAQYYAQSIQRRFLAALTDLHCLNCRRSTDHRINFVWEISFKRQNERKSWRLSGSAEAAGYRFVTTHISCPDCINQFEQRSRLIAVLLLYRFVGQWCGLALLIALIFASRWLGPNRWIAPVAFGIWYALNIVTDLVIRLQRPRCLKHQIHKNVRWWGGRKVAEP